MNPHLDHAAGHVHQICEIQTLSEHYVVARRITHATLARNATGSSTWLERCAQGRVTIQSAIAYVEWLSEHWPPGLEWPEGIERPNGGSNPVNTAARESERLAACARLGPSGEVATPAALCRALGVGRSVFYAVVSRYSDETGAERWPRPGSASEQMLIALSATGDRRFASRRGRAAA